MLGTWNGDPCLVPSMPPAELCYSWTFLAIASMASNTRPVGVTDEMGTEAMTNLHRLAGMIDRKLSAQSNWIDEVLTRGPGIMVREAQEETLALRGEAEALRKANQAMGDEAAMWKTRVLMAEAELGALRRAAFSFPQAVAEENAGPDSVNANPGRGYFDP